MMMPAWCSSMFSGSTDMLCIRTGGSICACIACVEWDSVKALVLVELLENENPRSRPFKLGHKETFSK